jgi:hypothetical protein
VRSKYKNDQCWSNSLDGLSLLRFLDLDNSDIRSIGMKFLLVLN